MKTLAILAVILGILFLYFVVKAEKSLVIIKGGEAVPGGIDVPKLIFNKAKEIRSLIVSDKNIKPIGDNAIIDSGRGFIDNITTDAKNLVSKTVDKISETIKNPIENKIQEIICPAK